MVNEILKVSDIVDNDNQKSKQNIMDKFGFRRIIKKYFKVFILIAVFVTGVIIYLSVSSKETVSTQSTSSINNKYLTTLEYSASLENKLKDVLSKVKGVGSVSVMITLDGSPEVKYASDEDTKTSANATSTTTTSTSTPIIVSVGGESTPLILSESLPQVKGVIIVSSGASDISVKLDILNAVSTLLDISKDKVIVLKGI